MREVLLEARNILGYGISSNDEKIATPWGKIHYLKDGTHLVPTKPRK